MTNNGAFSKFITEFGSKEESSEEDNKAANKEHIDEKAHIEAKKQVKGGALMQLEERNTGAISGAVYRNYLKAGNGAIVLPFLLLSVVCIQAATVMSSYWFVL